MINKIKAWLAATGLSNLGWAAGFAGAIFMGWMFAAGICAGIFVHLNYSVIKELIKGIG
jgi:hypothetical protein